MGGGEGDARLADTARPGKGDEARAAAQEGRSPVDLRSTADERRDRCRQVAAGPHCLGLDVERCVVAQDRGLEAAQLGSRLEPQLVQRPVAVGVDLESIRLATRPVEREHQEASQPLPEGIVDDEGLEHVQVGIETERKCAVGAILERRDPELLEAASVCQCAVALDPRERRAAPQAERCVDGGEGYRMAAGIAMHSRVGEQPLELVGVAARGLEPIAARVPDDVQPVLPQRRHVDLQRVNCARRRILVPEGVHEPLIRHRSAAGDYERDEESTVLRPAAERDAVDLDRPEYPDLHDPPLDGRFLPHEPWPIHSSPPS